MIADDIVGERILLTPVGDAHITERYLGWMNDPEVNRYLESRHQPTTIEGLAVYVESMRKSPDNYFFAIIDRESGEYWGNVKLGPVNRYNLTGAIGIIVGEPAAWGKGVATETITMLTGWAFETLGLAKLTAGCFVSNAGSARAFEKAGWFIEGRQASQVRLDDGTREDTLLLGVVNPSV